MQRVQTPPTPGLQRYVFGKEMLRRGQGVDFLPAFRCGSGPSFDGCVCGGCGGVCIVREARLMSSLRTSTSGGRPPIQGGEVGGFCFGGAEVVEGYCG